MKGSVRKRVKIGQIKSDSERKESGSEKNCYVKRMNKNKFEKSVVMEKRK